MRKQLRWSLGDAWADTTMPRRRPMLTVLGGLAEFERPRRRMRPRQGARCQARSQPKLTPHQKREAHERRDEGEETRAEIARRYNVSGWTIARLIA